MNRRIKIKDLTEEERPREKLLTKGVEDLTDVELLAILFGTGNRNKSCLEIARNLLKKFGNINKLLSLSSYALRQIEDIGPARACLLTAVSEISKRISVEIKQKDMFCRSPEEAFFAIKKDLMGKEKEQVIVLHLNSRNRLLSKELISIGTLNESLISAREILKSALERNSCNLIIAHNHPSGDPTPSTEDIKITQHLHRACKLAGIQLMDHIIIANSKYSSLKSLGVLERR